MSVPHEISKQVHERNKFICVYCNLDGRLSYQNYKSLTIDHIRPKIFGDNHSLQNLVTACFACNQLKGHYFPKHLADEKEVMNDIKKYISKQRMRDFERYIETVKPFLKERK
ncbi:MAG: HNH endonuclease [Ignavibacteriales bacterium]|nr:HNH endonuclease [Ignavibacteriales bacterium]